MTEGRSARRKSRAPSRTLAPAPLDQVQRQQRDRLGRLDIWVNASSNGTTSVGSVAVTMRDAANAAANWGAAGTAPCNDGNACTQSDTCEAGACTGANPVVCSALDQCHDAGMCDPMTGVCSNPVKANGSACDDGNACTIDACDEDADTCDLDAEGNPQLVLDPDGLIEAAQRAETGVTESAPTTWIVALTGPSASIAMTRSYPLLLSNRTV
mgnify:CR=1 FL=1